jgi:hypothetical protein
MSSLEYVSFASLKPLQGFEHTVSMSSLESSATASSTLSKDSSSSRFRGYQSDQWADRYEELRAYVQKHGHCQISHREEEQNALARWSKRQRYQFKLLQDGKPSTMTPERIEALNALGFAWNSHEAVWEERLNELRLFRRAHGHVNIPSIYEPNQKLSTWAKCQRRQKCLLDAGKRSNMTWSRVKRLEELGFVWKVRPQPSSH